MSAAPLMQNDQPVFDDETLQRALREHFGHERFRPGQESIVRSVLSGRPTIAILPTGGGKSLCYQLPALLLPGTTVVVSPLVALMKDQVDALTARGIPATYINSSLTDGERTDRQAALRRGEWRLVYVAPERFRSSTFLSAVEQIQCPLLAVDEAHCISAWGHDFRPDYQRLAQARRQLSAARILALTATATPEVRSDIAAALELDDPRVFVAGFDRPNLFIEVARAAGDKEKLGRIFALARTGAPGLVYAATRRNVEKIVAALQDAGLSALGYHAGMADDARSAVQEAFLQSRVRVVVATNAFGMGVDKPDIRSVAHFDVPKSLEAYYQEIGRAGRDGQASLAVLLFNYADVLLQRRMIEASYAEPAFVRRVWAEVQKAPEGRGAAIAQLMGVRLGEIQTVFKLLGTAGHLQRRGSLDYLALTPQVPADELAVPFELAAQRVARERQMLDRLVRFTATSSCRRQNLLHYFGESEVGGSCGSCDRCAGSRAPAAEPLAETAARRLPAVTAEPAALEGPFDAAVYQALRALRLELARETSVPPYVVCHDSMLRDLSRALPRNEREFLAVKGMGPGRWLKYGPRIIAITGPAADRDGALPGAAARSPAAASGDVPAISDRDEDLRDYGQRRTRTPLQSAMGAGQPPSSSIAGAEQDLEEIWDLYLAGLDLESIARRRKEPVGATASLLAAACEAGRVVDAPRIMGEDRVRAIRRAADAGHADMRSIRERMHPVPVSFGEIRLALATPTELRS